MAARMCSEWGLREGCAGSLEGLSPQALTCGVACRQHRARRLKAARIDSTALEATRGVRELVRAGGQDAVQAVLKQELTPLVREAIDDDVLAAIGKMVGLTTKAVARLERDLDGEDAVIAQRAAALVVKYTVGHPALVKPVDETPQALTVHFNLPRPDGTVEAPAVDEEGEEITDFVCDQCGEERAAELRVAGSDRCEICFQATRAAILERHGLTA